MNFLHLTTFYPPYSFGGDAMYIYRLTHALGEAGHHVDVIHCIDAYHLLHPAPPEIPFADHPNVHVHGLQTGYGTLSPLVTQQTGQPGLKRPAIQAILDSRCYDVIHYHNISLLGPGVLGMTSRQGDAVKMYTTHEHWLICPTHVLWQYNRQACQTPHCLRCTLMARKPPQLWRYTGMLAEASRHVDQFVAPSRFTADMHAARGFPQPVDCLPYFCDRRDDDWRQQGPRPWPRPYCLFVGRLEVIKGLQTILDDWDESLGCDLLVAGTGTHEAALRQQAADNPRIHFLGPVSQSQLGALYAHALAVVVPSITYETFGMIIIEAYARKTPVIVRDLGALPEVVAESGGGFIYTTNTELRAAVQRFASVPGLRDELGERGYAAFLRHWTREAHLDAYFGFLHACAERKFGHVPWQQEELCLQPL